MFGSQQSTRGRIARTMNSPQIRHAAELEMPLRTGAPSSECCLRGDCASKGADFERTHACRRTNPRRIASTAHLPMSTVHMLLLDGFANGADVSDMTIE